MKKFLKWFLITLIILNLAILVSGKSYLYKTIANTVFKGRLGPSIDEYLIFENREIKAGKGQAWRLGKDLNKKTINPDHRKAMEELRSVAFLVIVNDSLRYEEYWDGKSAETYTNSFSAAKSIVAVLIGIAIDEGIIKSIDQPVSDFFPEYARGMNAKLTVKHLLTMSSGIAFDEDYINPLSYPAQSLYGTDLKKLTVSYGVVEEPGKKFRYLSGNTAILGFILEKASGKKLSDYASEKLWIPMGAERSAFWSLDHADGMEKAFCCFNSNARDFARFGKLYLDSGRWEGKQLVSQDYVLNSVKPAELLDEDGNKISKYGYSWWIAEHKNLKLFYARGILGQYILVIPERKMIVVRLGHKRNKEKIGDHPKDVFLYMDIALGMYPQ